MSTELFVDAGANANKVKPTYRRDCRSPLRPWVSGRTSGLGARRAVSDRNDLGVRLELDEVQGAFVARRAAFDYRHRFGESFAMDCSPGVARYDLATPAYSLYAGLGAQWRNVLPNWDVGADFRYAQTSPAIMSWRPIRWRAGGEFL